MIYILGIVALALFCIWMAGACRAAGKADRDAEAHDAERPPSPQGRSDAA